MCAGSLHHVHLHKWEKKLLWQHFTTAFASVVSFMFFQSSMFEGCLAFNSTPCMPLLLWLICWVGTTRPSILIQELLSTKPMKSCVWGWRKKGIGNGDQGE